VKIPEIDPSEVEHLSSEDVEGMGEEELKHYVHELEVKPYVSEGAVKILKAEGAEELGNDGKAVLIDARPKRITVAEPLELSSLSSSSYYCRSKLEREDRYAEARSAIKEEFEFVRGIYGCRCIHHRLPEREEQSVSRARRWALMAEEGCVVPYAKKRRRYSSHKGEVGNVPDNIVDRNFHASAPNRLWLMDVISSRSPPERLI